MTKDEYPLVSVVMPAYNSADFIAQSLTCALSQSYCNVEIIVVDDGSTDNTVEIVSSYGDNITLIQQQNAGSASARNRGAAAASGEWLAFLDSDDLWTDDKIERLCRRASIIDTLERHVLEQRVTE